MENIHFELYASGDGVIALSEPTRIRIVHFLSDSAKDFDEVVAYIGKAKSTVSSHLDRLEEIGIIKSEINPSDARKRTYLSIAKLIGVSSKSEPKVYILDRTYFSDI